MSRGRLENRLYALVGDPPLADDLDIFLDPPASDPISAISAALERTGSQRLATDQRRSLPMIQSAIQKSGDPPPPVTAHSPTPAGTSTDTADASSRLIRLRRAHREELAGITEATEALASNNLSRRHRRLLGRQLALHQDALEQIRQQSLKSSAGPHKAVGSKAQAPSSLMAQLGVIKRRVANREREPGNSKLIPRATRSPNSAADHARRRPGISGAQPPATSKPTAPATPSPTARDALGALQGDSHHQEERQAFLHAIDAVKRINTMEADSSIEQPYGVDLD